MNQSIDLPVVHWGELITLLSDPMIFTKFHILTKEPKIKCTRKRENMHEPSVFRGTDCLS